MRPLAHPTRLLALALSLVLAALAAPARAEDIDIYAEPNNAAARISSLPLGTPVQISP